MDCAHPPVAHKDLTSMDPPYNFLSRVYGAHEGSETPLCQHGSARWERLGPPVMLGQTSRPNAPFGVYGNQYKTGDLL